MKRASAHLFNFKRESKNRAFFSKLSNFYFDLRPSGQDRRAKTRPQGQLECVNPLGLPGVWSGLELTDTLKNPKSVHTHQILYISKFYYFLR